jgi:hypothetical protein
MPDAVRDPVDQVEAARQLGAALEAEQADDPVDVDEEDRALVWFVSQGLSLGGRGLPFRNLR